MKDFLSQVTVLDRATVDRVMELVKETVATELDVEREEHAASIETHLKGSVDPAIRESAKNLIEARWDITVRMISLTLEKLHESIRTNQTRSS